MKLAGGLVLFGAFCAYLAYLYFDAAVSNEESFDSRDRRNMIRALVFLCLTVLSIGALARRSDEIGASLRAGTRTWER
jgi:hypothetical protein